MAQADHERDAAALQVVRRRRPGPRPGSGNAAAGPRDSRRSGQRPPDGEPQGVAGRDRQVEGAVVDAALGPLHPVEDATSAGDGASPVAQRRRGWGDSRRDSLSKVGSLAVSDHPRGGRPRARRHAAVRRARSASSRIVAARQPGKGDRHPFRVVGSSTGPVLQPRKPRRRVRPLPTSFPQRLASVALLTLRVVPAGTRLPGLLPLVPAPSLLRICAASCATWFSCCSSSDRS